MQLQKEQQRQSDSEAPEAELEELHPPATWGRDETYLRTLTWSGMTPGEWSPSDLGGSDIHRRLRNYAIDHASAGTPKGCSKYQHSNCNLLPGLFLYWCCEPGCGKCIGFSVMESAESVRTPFEFLHTRCDTAPDSYQQDNGCNADQFFRNREPAFFAGTELLIDQPHFAGHVTCSENYSTSAFTCQVVCASCC